MKSQYQRLRELHEALAGPVGGTEIRRDGPTWTWNAAPAPEWLHAHLAFAPGVGVAPEEEK